MLKAPLCILIVAALCLVALATLVVREGMARDAGTEILLTMEAVDPRALLSGHYVIVDLRERITPSSVCPERTGQQQWLALAPNGDHHSFAGATADRESAAQLGPIVVRGDFDCFVPAPDTAPETATEGWTSLNLGIDRFHINQTDAERIEHVLRDQAISEATPAYAIVSVGRDGRARLKGLVVDGERIELNWL